MPSQNRSAGAASTTNRETRISLIGLSFLAILVGIVTGGGAIVFRGLIAFIHNLFFLGEFSLVQDANQMTPVGAWGPFIVLAPVVGGLGVVWLVRNFAPEAKGHGVPEVMDAVFYREGRIRPVVAVVKSLASALSIGSGAAVGREGPIIQIGSSFGSSVAQLCRIAAWQRVTLVAAGAGAGIAATFNTPLGGVMFAIELMMPEVSSRTFLPVVLATATATYIGRLAFGMEPAFVVPIAELPSVGPLNFATLMGFIALGLLCGLASWMFVRLLARLETLFPRLLPNEYVQHGVGMLLVGGMIYGLSVGYGHYFIEGVGYGTIQGVLRGDFVALDLLAILFVAKLLATTISLGSGASGGIFSPSLFLGTALGGALGAGLDLLWPGAGFSPAEFAMVGMAGTVGGATGAAMTAIVMIFEMTRDYNIIVPMVMAVGLSIGVRRVLSAENIYTIKLAARGRHIPKERHINMFLVRHARELMCESVVSADAAQPLAEVLALRPDGRTPDYAVVCEGDRIHGLADLRPYRRRGTPVPDCSVEAVADNDFVLARPDDILNDVMKRLGHGHGAFALVTNHDGGVPRRDDIVGVLALDDVGRAVLSHFQR